MKSYLHLLMPISLDLLQKFTHSKPLESELLVILQTFSANIVKHFSMLLEDRRGWAGLSLTSLARPGLSWKTRTGLSTWLLYLGSVSNDQPMMASNHPRFRHEISMYLSSTFILSIETHLLWSVLCGVSSHLNIDWCWLVIQWRKCRKYRKGLCIFLTFICFKWSATSCFTLPLHLRFSDIFP